MSPQPARRFTTATPCPHSEDIANQHSAKFTMPWRVGLTAAGIQTLLIGTFTATQATPAPEEPVGESPQLSPYNAWETTEQGPSENINTEPPTAEDDPAALSPFWNESAPAIKPTPQTTAPTSRIAEGTVTVRSGESLWSITQDLLGPEASHEDISAAWPTLWAANDETIHDPDVLQPGTILNVPSGIDLP